MQPITLERSDPKPPRRPAPAIIGGVVGLAALLIVFAAGSGGRSDAETEAALTLPPPMSTTVVPTTNTTTPAVRRHQSTIVPWDEALAGPSLAVEEATAPEGLAYVAWMGQVGSRIAAVGPRTFDRFSARGAAVAWSDDGLGWSPPTIVAETGDFGAVSSSPVGLVIAVTGPEGHASDELVIHASRDGFEWVGTSLGSDAYVTSAVVGPAGASIFVERSAPTRFDELLSAVPAEVRRVVDQRHGWLEVEGSHAVLMWNHGLEMWSAPLAELGLDGLRADELYGEPSMAFYTSVDLVSWAEQPEPFGDARWFVYDRIWGEGRTGVVAYSDSGLPPRVWWSEDGVTWQPADPPVRADAPAIELGRVMHSVDYGGSTPAFLSTGPGDRSHRRRFEPPSGFAWSPHQPSVGPAGLVWTVALYGTVEEVYDVAIPLEDTVGEIVVYDVSGSALLADVKGVQQRWSLWGETNLTADLEAGTIQLLTEDGEVVSEFPFDALDRAVEVAYRPGGSGSALVFAPDDGAWGITELDSSIPTAITALGDGWLVATNAGWGWSEPRMYRVSAPGR